MSKKVISRREFVRTAGIAAAGVVMASCSVPSALTSMNATSPAVLPATTPTPASPPKAVAPSPVVQAPTYPTAAPQPTAAAPAAVAQRRSSPTAVPRPTAIEPLQSLNLPVVDLRPIIKNIGLEVRTQTNGAPCASHALTFLLEYQYIRRVFSDLSEQYLQYVTFEVEKPHMTGGENFWALNIGYQKWGFVPQAYVPNADQTPSSVPGNILDAGKIGLRMTQEFIKNWDSNNGASQDQVNKAVEYLNQDTPVAMGLLWPKDFQTHKVHAVDLMQVPTAANKFDVVEDGHAVALVGCCSSSLFPGNGFFIFRNSWGKTWGDQGYGYMPFEYALRYANDLCVVKLPNSA